MATPDHLVPMAPNEMWKPKLHDNEENEDGGNENEYSNHQGDEDAGEDQHDPSESDSFSGSQKAVGIRHAHINDVLCGRGGLTNNHPGNEWFRKLVRSNRPLYHACPKHTKLLVSKAIVQAVQAQDPPGRFLERNKKDKLWYPVSYKKAVDKTSQGLREKERGDEVYDSPLPAILTNRGPKLPANLQDLARVTMARAGLDPILHTQSNNKRPSPADKDGAEVKPTTKKQKPMLPTKNTVRTKASPPVAITPTLQEWDEPLPLPTQPLQVRQSSMFRWISQTKLLNEALGPGVSGPAAAPATAPASFAAPSNPFMSAPAVAAAAYAAAQANKAPAASAPWFYGSPMPPPPPAASLTAADSSIIAPTESTVLTRLTSQFSQFSDLFGAFWPQPSIGNSISNYHQQQQQQQHQHLQQRREAIESAAETAVTMMTFATAPAATDNDAVSGNVEDIIPPSLSFSKSSLSIPTIFNDDDDDIEDDPITSAIQPDRDQPANNTERAHPDDTAKVAGPPTELERSASATLLKLASSPTKFFPSLSGFFTWNTTTTLNHDYVNGGGGGGDDDDGVAKVGQHMQPIPSPHVPPFLYDSNPARAAAAQSRSTASFAPPLVGNAKRSRQSLLDDDEETPEVTRLRTVRSG